MVGGDGGSVIGSKEAIAEEKQSARGVISGLKSGVGGVAEGDGHHWGKA